MCRVSIEVRVMVFCLRWKRVTFLTKIHLFHEAENDGCSNFCFPINRSMTSIIRLSVKCINMTIVYILAKTPFTASPMVWHIIYVYTREPTTSLNKCMIFLKELKHDLRSFFICKEKQANIFVQMLNNNFILYNFNLILFKRNTLVNNYCYISKYRFSALPFISV